MKTTHPIFRWTLVAAAATLAACSTPPSRIDDPLVAAPRPGPFAQGQGLEVGGRAQAEWWTIFEDPVLDGLIGTGLSANLDVRQSAERVLRSRAIARAHDAERGPFGRLALGGVARQWSQTEAPGLTSEARRDESVSVGQGLAWELDLFGRLRQAAGAAQARADATAADAEALRLAVSAEIAHAWFAVNGAREQIRLAQEVVRNRQATLELVLRRLRAGHAAMLDETRARAELAGAQAQLPRHEAALAVAGHRLAVLLGRNPSGFVPPPRGEAAQRPLALRIPEPSQWVASRPDLRAAEARLRAQALDVASVRAEFMPRLSVSGLLGFVAGSVSGLGAAASASWFFAPQVSVPVFDVPRIQARLEAARAEEREALLAYHQRMLTATEEVESALAQVRQGQVQLAALQQRAGHADQAETLARRRYEAGASDLLELLEAQRTAQAAAVELAAAWTAQGQHIVTLQRSLGARFLPGSVAVAEAGQAR